MCFPHCGINLLYDNYLLSSPCIFTCVNIYLCFFHQPATPRWPCPPAPSPCPAELLAQSSRPLTLSSINAHLKRHSDHGRIERTQGKCQGWPLWSLVQALWLIEKGLAKHIVSFLILNFLTKANEIIKKDDLSEGISRSGSFWAFHSESCCKEYKKLAWVACCVRDKENTGRVGGP